MKVKSIILFWRHQKESQVINLNRSIKLLTATEKVNNLILDKYKCLSAGVAKSKLNDNLWEMSWGSEENFAGHVVFLI